MMTSIVYPGQGGGFASELATSGAQDSGPPAGGKSVPGMDVETAMATLDDFLGRSNASALALMDKSMQGHEKVTRALLERKNKAIQDHAAAEERASHNSWWRNFTSKAAPIIQKIGMGAAAVTAAVTTGGVAGLAIAGAGAFMLVCQCMGEKYHLPESPSGLAQYAVQQGLEELGLSSRMSKNIAGIGIGVGAAVYCQSLYLADPSTAGMLATSTVDGCAEAHGDTVSEQDLGYINMAFTIGAQVAGTVVMLKAPLAAPAAMAKVVQTVRMVGTGTQMAATVSGAATSIGSAKLKEESARATRDAEFAGARVKREDAGMAYDRGVQGQELTRAGRSAQWTETMRQLAGDAILDHEQATQGVAHV
jgi:hypothetical protein